MELLFFLTLLFGLYSTGASRYYPPFVGVKCQSCTDQHDPKCQRVKEIFCPYNKMCITASALVKVDGMTLKRVYKDCVGPHLCKRPGTRTFSTNLGDDYSLASAKCCRKNKCNAVTLPFPEAQKHSRNRRQCPACGNGNSTCAQTVMCRGDEDTCFSAKLIKLGQKVKVYGCGTDNVCKAAYKLGHLPFFEDEGTVTEKLNCTPAPPPSARTCQVCTNSTCENMTSQTCGPDVNMCVTAAVSGMSVPPIYKGCATRALCPATGTQIYSLDIGRGNTLAKVKCCDYDDCNNETLSAPTLNSTQTGRCSTCFPETRVCAFTKACQGMENNCIQTSTLTRGTVLPIMGCASDNLCRAPAVISTLLFPTMNMQFTVNCCEGSLCNDPSRPAPATTPRATEPPTTKSPFPTFAFPKIDSPVLKDDVLQQIVLIIQQIVLYLQALQMQVQELPLEQQLLVQPVLLLIQQLFVYLQLVIRVDSFYGPCSLD